MRSWVGQIWGKEAPHSPFERPEKCYSSPHRAVLHRAVQTPPASEPEWDSGPQGGPSGQSPVAASLPGTGKSWKQPAGPPTP